VVCGGGGRGNWRSAGSGIAGNGGENAVRRSKSRVLSKACPDDAAVKGISCSDVVRRAFQILDRSAVWRERSVACGIALGIAGERDEASKRGVAVAGGSSSGSVADHFITIEVASIAANAWENVCNVSAEVASVEAVRRCNVGARRRGVAIEESIQSPATTALQRIARGNGQVNSRRGRRSDDGK